MKNTIGCIIGLVFVVSALAEPLLEGRVRLDSGEPVADAQVRIFDLTDLQRGAIARATTDGTGYFALPLAALTGSALPTSFTLGQNYPNPFNPSTIIPYQLAASSQVRLEVFNLLGQHIATLVDGERSAGFHTATWHATDRARRAVGAGVYIYRMTVEAESQTGRMVLIDGQAGISAAGAASNWLGVSGVGGPAEGVYGLIVSGSGLVPYVDSSFRVEAGMAPVELVVSSGLPSAGKATDDDCAFCDLFDSFNDEEDEEEEEEDVQEEEEEATEEEEETDNTSNQGGPDLVVEPPLVVGSYFVSPGDTFTLLVTVRNQGNSQAAVTTLRYYRSTDATISTRDTEVGTDAVDTLAAAVTSTESISLTAPSSEGTYYYGACVASVAGESNTDNNCSSSRAVRVWSESSPVTIPDARLRAAIEGELGKASGAMITVAEMMALSTLKASDVVISDLTGLEFAVNLTELVLYGSNISDLSPLSGLTKLTSLWLGESNISDIAPLSGLTGLRFLGLHNNNISDIAPLSGLTNLIRLWLDHSNVSDLSPLSGLTNLQDLGLPQNNVSDLSPLSGLTNLRDLGLRQNNVSDVSSLSGLTNLGSLDLAANNISDLSPLRGLTNLGSLDLTANNISDLSPLRGLTFLTELHLRVNLLSLSSINDHIPSLKRSGVTVHSDSFHVVESDFDIELVFFDDDFTQAEKRMIQHAARRWMSIIREDLPDYTFNGGLSSPCGGPALPSGERVDDLRIYVTSAHSIEDPSGWASGYVLRSTSSLPVLGCVTMNLHAIRSPASYLLLSFLDTAIHEIGHALGIGTIWDDLGFLQDPNGDAHFNGPLAIAAFNDAGGRNYTGAKVPVAGKDRGPGMALSHWSSVLWGDIMALGGQVGEQALSAITIQSLADLGYNVDVTQADPYTLPLAAAKASAKIAAPSTYAEPEWSCGVGQEQEPIYVVDPQGRIVRTISP